MVFLFLNFNPNKKGKKMYTCVSLENFENRKKLLFIARDIFQPVKIIFDCKLNVSNWKKMCIII